MEASSGSLLVLYKVFFWRVVTGFKIVAIIVAKSRDTLNTVTKQIPKFFEIYTQGSVNDPSMVNNRIYSCIVLPSVCA